MKKIFFTYLLISIAFYSKSQITTTTFLPHLDFVTGSDPTTAAIEDIDGDGKPDIVVTNFNDPSISVYRNTNTKDTMDASSFVKQDFTTGWDPYVLRLADVDGDSKYDVIVAGYNQVTLLRNSSTTGNISFEAPVYLDARDNSYELAVDDMNGDGLPDIIVIGNEITDAYFSIFTNKMTSPGTLSDTSFSNRLDYRVGKYIVTVTTGDIDGDGKSDVVAGMTDSVMVFRNIGGDILKANSFDTPDTLLNINSDDIAVYDIDLDGKNDLVISEIQTWLTLVRNNNSPGSIDKSNFNSYAKFDIAGQGGTNPQRLTINDFDADGMPDIAIANSGPSVVSVLRNISSPGALTTSSLGDTVNFATPYRANGMASADLNGDGKVDIVAVDGVNGVGSLISIFQNLPPVLTSVSSFNATTGLNVYPNPASGSVNIRTVTNISKVTILSVTGKECYTGAYNSSNVTVDISNLVKGMYLVEVYSADGKNSVSKLSIE